MIAALGKAEKNPPPKIKLEEVCDEIHDHMVFSHWKHS
jgi:hypothetical protein